MAFVAVVGAGAVFVAAGDWLSKKLAGPGVAGEGLSDRQATSSESHNAALGTRQRLLVIFGASGGTGVALVQVALEAGYRVRAVVRSARRLARELDSNLLAHECLEVCIADLEDLQAVRSAVAGSYAVLSVAGARPESAPGPMAAAVPAMVEGCREHGVQKLIVQACAVSAAPGERWGWLTQARVVRNVLKYQMGSSIVEDNDRVLSYLYHEARDLDWVVLRPPGLQDGDRRGPLSPSLEPFRTASVRYLDVADWALAQVESSTYVGKMPRLYYEASGAPL